MIGILALKYNKFKTYVKQVLIVIRCGKVCLSLLGTWEGQKGEQWNEKTSTVLQVNVNLLCGF